MIAADRAVKPPWYRRLHYQVLLAMALGLGLGIGFGPAASDIVGWMGTLFLQALKMVIVPLVLTSLTSGVASIGSGRELGRIGAKTLGYYVASSLLAILVGLFFVNMIRPGHGAAIEGIEGAAVPEIAGPEGPGGFLLQLALDFIPLNPVRAMAEGQMLGIIGFSLFLGIAIAHLPAEPRAGARRAVGVAFQVMMKLTSGVIRLLPLGVLGLITSAAATSGADTFKALGWYIATVASGLTIHLFVTLPLLLLLLGRIDPRIHFRNMVDALVTAFSTSSSGATMPVTLDRVENKVGVSNRVTSFVIPMGATVNMDGTALVECVGVMFIAQVLGADLGIAQQATIVVTALAASIGAAAVPSAGLVMIFIVLKSVNLDTPAAEAIVGMMIAIDRPLDMYRTAVNVMSDSCGAAIIARSEGEKDVDTR
jgi:Na+/H+-dicarboxylate symporter